MGHVGHGTHCMIETARLPQWPQSHSERNCESLPKVMRQSTTWFLSLSMHNPSHYHYSPGSSLCMPQFCLTQNSFSPTVTVQKIQCCLMKNKTEMFRIRQNREAFGFQTSTELRQRKPRSSSCKVLKGSLFKNNGPKTTKLIHMGWQKFFTLTSEYLSCKNFSNFPKLHSPAPSAWPVLPGNSAELFPRLMTTMLMQRQGPATKRIETNVTRNYNKCLMICSIRFNALNCVFFV